jgi:hypothetical protein
MEATRALTPPSNGLAGALRQLFERAIDLEFTSPLAFAALAVAYFASRAAWLDLGYGTDPDAWRVALTAEYFWREGEYLPSRLPGYPLHELVTAGAVKGGWVWTNLSTVFISVAGLYVFAWLARKLELPHRGALVVGFAFAPLLWINSVQTMDYMWALTFVLGAYLALLYKSPTLAGLSLGVAAGFRLTSLFMLVPFALFLWQSQRRGEIRPVAFTALAVTLVVYLLVLMDYGINFLNFYDQDVEVDEFVKRLGKDGLGIIGGLALIAGIVVSLGRLRAFPRDLARDPHVLLWASAIVIYFLSYTRLPHEIAYLLPLFPFGFFLMARYFARAVLVAVLGAILLAGFVDVTSPADEIGLSTETFTSARLGTGMVLSDRETLQNQMDFAREVRQLTLNHPDFDTPAVVVVGFIYPELAMLYKDELDFGILENDLEAISQLSDKGFAQDRSRDVIYVWLLEFDEFQGFNAEGRSIYLTADAARSTFAVYGYRPGYFGALELPLSRDNPSVAGTAETDR